MLLIGVNQWWIQGGARDATPAYILSFSYSFRQKNCQVIVLGPGSAIASEVNREMYTFAIHCCSYNCNVMFRNTLQRDNKLHCFFVWSINDSANTTCHLLLFMYKWFRSSGTGDKKHLSVNFSHGKKNRKEVWCTIFWVWVMVFKLSYCLSNGHNWISKKWIFLLMKTYVL